ncbi:MAG: sigma-E factor negative regulatory protein, partial [Gammaproteobacteria bacterium]|nr:sigma-E factor negative regulatory protein [Gammaproteobacteria bacterium]
MKENLSAFMDGELEHSESLELIKELSRDDELLGKWHRYNTFSSVLKGEITEQLPAGFSDRVIQQLAKEPVQFVPAAVPRRKRLAGPVAGFAVAASLVGIAILLQKPVINDATDDKLSSVAQITAPALPVAKSELPTADSNLIVANSKNENIRERINQLLVEHNEYNPAGDMTGML